MRIALAVLLGTIAVIASLVAVVMGLGLRIAQVSAGEHADVASFLWWIIPAGAVAVLSGGAAIAVAWGEAKRNKWRDHFTTRKF